MGHSHEQTLLARLGFQDPDRKTPDHDLACRYLSQRDQLRKIAALYYPFTLSWQSRGKTWETTYDKCVAGNAVLEAPITKGEGKYKTHIGFLDIIATFTFGSSITEPSEQYGKTITIEVKILPLDISTILRQINLYKEYCGYKEWLLVTAFPLNVEEVKSLGNIKHVYLNPSYKNYANQPVAESQVI